MSSQFFLSGGEMSEEERMQRDGATLAANIPVEAEILGINNNPLRGRLSFHLDVLRSAFPAVQLRLLNLVFFDVTQSDLSRTEAVRNIGTLGLTALDTDNIQMIYDAGTLTLSRESIPVQSHYSQMNELFPPVFRDGENADFAVPKFQQGIINLTIRLHEPLGDIMEKAGSGEINETPVESWATVHTEQFKSGPNHIPGYDLSVTSLPSSMSSADLSKFETARKLVLQPVSIICCQYDPLPTGLGLKVGKPEAIGQWRKACIIFEFRDWITLKSHSLKVIKRGLNETALLNSLPVNDCVKIFFIENFNPIAEYGGGATWSIGTPDAQIITSDGNAAGRSAKRHLAHELGHALGLEHPRDSPPSSPGSVMCPSGFRRDNPALNSVRNAKLVRNPLLQVAVMPIGPGLDCRDECGDC